MWLIVIGVVLLVMNVAGIGPVGEWTWGWGEKGLYLLIPFGLAAVWWFIADVTGYTQRKAMEKLDAKQAARRQKAMDALGMGKPGARRRK